MGPQTREHPSHIPFPVERSFRVSRILDHWHTGTGGDIVSVCTVLFSAELVFEFILG